MSSERDYRGIWPGVRLTIVLLCLCAGVQSAGHSVSLSGKLDRYGLSIPGAEGFEIEKEFSGPGRNSTTLIARDRDRVIRLRVTSGLDPEMAERYIKEQIIMLESIFEPSLPPYPEFLTYEMDCPEKFKPVRCRSRTGDYFLLYASERLGYGVCTEDLARYRAAVMDFHSARTGHVFKLEYFVPGDIDPKELKDFIEAVSCRHINRATDPE